eukprot:TRINITY_DN8222_c0_g2_i1.p1 TRINITY_DN8222_c0_g2~~TRINITY_DN8222_c0_g2_i1.p1  ORF type:complete len:359 (+),score=96.87 TRINITY_DN8222_c0_g2_i1:88-1164(+)
MARTPPFSPATPVLDDDDGASTTSRKSGMVEQQVGRLLPILEAHAEKRAPAVAPVLQFMRPFLVRAGALLDEIGPYLLTASKYLYEVYRAAPTDLLYALLGLSLCFFGGFFVATIAAVEAFKLYGWDRCYAHLRCLWADYRIMRARARRQQLEARSKGEDVRDIPDHNRIFDPSISMTQRIAMMSACIQEPDKLSQAFTGLYTALLGVVTTLRLRFARTIALGASIAGMIHKPVEKHLGSRVAKMLPANQRQWAPTLLKWSCHFVAISLAWQVQKIIAAVQSALRGGLMFSHRSMKFARAHGYCKSIEPGSFFDDAVGYVVAAAGLYTQLLLGFNIPFPLNVVLLPVSVLEWWLVWFM